MNGDGLTTGISIAEVVALEHARDRILGGDLDQIGGAHLTHPAGVEYDERLLGVEDLKYLLLVGLGVLQHLVATQRLAGGVLARGITDHAGEITDQEQDLVAKVLELPQLVDQHRVPQVKVGGRRIEARLHTQGHPAPQLRDKPLLGEDFLGAAPDGVQGIR